MSFDRTRLPDPASYFESEGLVLTGRGRWRTTKCEFHNGSDSLRIKITTGAWVCMACGEKGGDVLAYHMAMHGVAFIDAARQLGAWLDDGKPTPSKPTPLSPRDALSVLKRDAMLVGIEACRMGKGIVPTPEDLARVRVAAGRINRLADVYE